MRNIEVREAAKEAGVFLWEVADRLGIRDNEFSRRLRKELPAAEKEKALSAISEIVSERGRG